MAWPNTFFYSGKGINTPLVDEPHPNKARARELSLDCGVGGERGDGALFFIVNVPGGIGLREEGGNSIENYGEGEAALLDIDRLVKNGIAPEDISVLSWYRGQIKTINLVSEAKYPRTEGFTSSTVDQAQGETKSVVLLTVGASAFNDMNSLYRNISKDMSWRISRYAKLASRLCVAVTRVNCFLQCLQPGDGISTR